ncbi:unnamed protein product [Polarella glacialis]|uniref:ALA-interacting subunit n=2 Tax=Polarella glacialis TaxID=89957 RepID=A0A813GJG1_POLGL|nr:unnamed protein product [Polarella glacialis]
MGNCNLHSWLSSEGFCSFQKPRQDSQRQTSMAGCWCEDRGGAVSRRMSREGEAQSSTALCEPWEGRARRLEESRESQDSRKMTPWKPEKASRSRTLSLISVQGSSELQGHAPRPMQLPPRSEEAPRSCAPWCAVQEPNGDFASAKELREKPRRPSPSRAEGQGVTEVEPQRGCLMRCVWAIAQQPETKVLLPLYWYRRRCQMACALFVAVFFAAVGGVLFFASRTVHEVIVPYTKNDAEKVFSLEQDIDGDVLVYYDLPQVNMNYRGFIESKDSRVVTTFGSRVVCEASDTKDWARLRRAGDPSFLARIEAVPTADLAPCGLVALSMFTDSFVFYKSLSDSSDSWEKLEADESDVALPADATAYQKKIHGPSSGWSGLEIGGANSWLTPGSFYEHWKVWYRTPASPHVRNLWAVIRGGLSKGVYKVSFSENSPIWEDWGVPEKLIVISGKHSLGNKGALRCLGTVCLCLAGAEVLCVLLFAAFMPVRSTSSAGSYKLPEIRS